jgi:antitoxin HigA-1
MAVEAMVTRRPAFRPVHPGVVLRDSVLPALSMPKTALADHLGISRQSLYEILNERRAVTADVAARLARALGNSTQFWLNLQSNHDAWAAERAEGVLKVKKLATNRTRTRHVEVVSQK